MPPRRCIQVLFKQSGRDRFWNSWEVDCRGIKIEFRAPISDDLHQLVRGRTRGDPQASDPLLSWSYNASMARMPFPLVLNVVFGLRGCSALYFWSGDLTFLGCVMLRNVHIPLTSSSPSSEPLRSSLLPEMQQAQQQLPCFQYLSSLQQSLAQHHLPAPHRARALLP